uniref:Uncharacterized protein n=1 Tax=Rhizophora mucronata TaxID=61149 RepID=A0A2P2QMA5_RHIMU
MRWTVMVAGNPLKYTKVTEGTFSRSQQCTMLSIDVIHPEFESFPCARIDLLLNTSP